MAPRKKPAVKGPFFFYMLEFRKREESNGRSFPGGMDQIVQEAGLSWNELNEAERQEYRTKAAAHKNQPRIGERFTAQGISYSQVEMEKQQLLEKQQKIGAVISEMIQMAVITNALEKMQVYIMSVNYFCKTSTNLFVPAELAMVRYNLELGVQATLHELINPGKLPVGLALEAKQHSEDTHELPVPPAAMGETDFDNVLQKILYFIDYSNYSKDKRLFPIMTEEKEVPVVESILEQFYEEKDIDHPFLVVPMGEFFFQIKRATEKYGLDICTFASKTVADILLSKDNYAYTCGIACDFHEKNGNARFCALSKATRWCYILSDNCCSDLSIDMIAGCHLPSNADTTLGLNMGETTSNVNLGQSDVYSMVSSVQTNYTLPSIDKQCDKSSFRHFDAPGPSRESEKNAVVNTNPFHIVNFKSSVSDPNLQISSQQEAATTTGCKTKEQDVVDVSQPAVSGTGRGRGTLLIDSKQSEAKPPAARQPPCVFEDMPSIGMNLVLKLSDEEED